MRGVSLTSFSPFQTLEQNFLPCNQFTLVFIHVAEEPPLKHNKEQSKEESIGKKNRTSNPNKKVGFKLLFGLSNFVVCRYGRS